MRNHDTFNTLLLNVTAPGHPMHRQHLSYDEAHSLIADPAASDRILDWVVSEPGLKVVHTHPHGRMICVEATVLTWQHVLKTTFGIFVPSCKPADCTPAQRQLLRGETGGLVRATDDVSVPTHIRDDVRALHGATQLPLGNRMQPMLRLDAECVGATCPVGIAQGIASWESLPILGHEVDVDSGLYLDRTNLSALFPIGEAVSWMDPSRISSRYCGTFSEAHYVGRGAPLCKLRDGVDDCSLNEFRQAGRVRIFGTMQQRVSTSDLSLAQELLYSSFYRVDNDGSPSETRLTQVGEIGTCDSPVDCTEANLDVQYAIGCSPPGRTRLVAPEFQYLGGVDPILDLIQHLSRDSRPAPVVTISYGTSEDLIDQDHLESFETEVKLLTLQGVTIFAAAGDSGVHSREAAENSASCGYSPLWPASSPWVTAVGASVVEREEAAIVAALGNIDYSQGERSLLAATRLAFSLSSGTFRSNATERAADASSAGDADFSTGGGFSKRYSAPPWQQSAVQNYFIGGDRGAVAGFNRDGRAYPDVSMVGHHLLVVIDKRLYYVSGTSAATPIVAAIASRVNLVRHANGLPQLGSLNPTLYAHHGLSAGMTFPDIVDGTNRCPAIGKCHCSEGFSAAPGWDPVSGLGVVDAAVLYEISLHDPQRPPSQPFTHPPAPTKSQIPVFTFAPTLARPFTPSPPSRAQPAATARSSSPNRRDASLRVTVPIISYLSMWIAWLLCTRSVTTRRKS